MSAVGKSQVTAWKDLLETKGLSADAPALEDYGLSWENDMLRLDEDDLVALCSKLKPFPSKLLRKWVQGHFHSHPSEQLREPSPSHS
jgi:hypothetical protein